MLPIGISTRFVPRKFGRNGPAGTGPVAQSGVPRRIDERAGRVKASPESLAIRRAHPTKELDTWNGVDTWNALGQATAVYYLVQGWPCDRRRRIGARRGPGWPRSRRLARQQLKRGQIACAFRTLGQNAGRGRSRGLTLFPTSCLTFAVFQSRVY